VLAAGANLGANIVYGVLIGQSSADVERDHVCWGEGVAAVAYSGVAVPANTVMLIIQPPAATTAGVREWTGYVFPNGIAMAAGPEVASDGRDGTDTAATDINVYTLLRDL
jgi:hypothetical protein